MRHDLTPSLEAAPAPERGSPRRRRADLPLAGAALVGLATLFVEDGVGRLVAALVLGVIGVVLLRAASSRAPAATPGDERSDLVAALDRAEAENAAKSRFLAMASHEIRTPLNGILGMADLLAETPLTSEQAAYVGAVHTSGTSLLELVDGMLDLARIEAGRFEVAAEPVDLETVVEEVVELLAPRAQAKGLEFASFVAPSLPRRVSADRVLLRQVLINLAGNAVKFTDAGGVAVVVEPTSAGRIAFRIRDTGIGIAPEDAGRIFAEFERGGAAGAVRPDGTGLGLAIARTIVERMGGEIRLDSRLGAGATFVFDLDCPAVDDVGARLQPLRGLRVLLLSDGVVEPPLLARRLHALGAETLLASRPDQIDASAEIDLALIDHREEADAASVFALLRARSATPVPAVVLIAPAARRDLPRLRDAGFVGHLVKPVRTASLAHVVGRLGAGSIPQEQAGPDSDTAPAIPSVPLDVLIVDDNEINILLARALLEHLGHRVTVVADGRSALDVVEQARLGDHPFAVVLMDLHMPGMDGFAAIRALRAAQPADEALTILAVTADATPAAATRAEACGADATMVKPIDRARLVDLLGGAHRQDARPGVAV